MIERAVSFGRRGNLIGIVSEPDAPPPPRRPDVLILNSGLVHKVGTFRLSVDLARKLASNGFRVLRFDLSGLGDSKMRIAREEGEDIPVSDTREAMDFLGERYGSRPFVLMGLCSGSDNSHRTALVDDRVVGAAHFDGRGYRTPKYYLHFGARFLSPKFVVQKLTRRRRHKSSQPLAAGVNAFARTFPPIEQSAREFAALMRRDVRLLYIYTRGVPDYANYREQLRDTFPSVDFGDRLELEFYPLAEHTYPLIRSRATVVNRVASWANRTFGG